MSVMTIENATSVRRPPKTQRTTFFWLRKRLNILDSLYLVALEKDADSAIAFEAGI
jgi:hypothetical protein